MINVEILKRVNKGFTLIELLVVIAIIGLLASVVLASLSSARNSARDSARLQVIKELQKALELYRNSHAGIYPCTNATCATNSVAYVNGTTRNATFDTAMSSYFTAQNEAINFAAGWLTTGSIQYHSGGTNAAADRESYTIAIRREMDATLPDGSTLAAGAWCEVNYGNNPYASWAYPNCF